jgi:hypothetical protein
MKRRHGLRVVESTARSAEGGGTNSRPSFTGETNVGADTLRLRSRSSSGAYERIGRLTHREGPRGERWLKTEGVRVGAYPDGLTYAESRAAVMLAGPEAHGLCSAAEVAGASERAVGLLCALVGEAETDPRAGRLDLTADLCFEDGREGLELLRAMSYVDVPWLKAGTEGAKRGRLESVVWRSWNGRSVQLRLYDKGVESGLAAPGTWLRLERQIRWRKARELRVSEVVGLDFGDLYRRRYLEALSDVSELVRVDRAGAVEELRRRQGLGELGRGELQALAGFVVAGDAGLSRSSSWRRWARLRELGIVLDLHDGGGQVVKLSDYVARASRAWERVA